ncbi:MAG: zinc ribbon domain-containing protein [Methanobacteriaceae archaeon]|nr:zinc ribbon domain-containing protein [Methanobacteriaceae archaeon]
MICPACGNRNDEDATYCEKCGRKLKINQNRGMNKSVKGLIIVCFVLVCLLGVAAGLLMHPDPPNISNPNQSDNTIEEPQDNVYQPTWHKIESFSGSGDDYQSFTTKGNRFKITFSSVPMITYEPSWMDVYVYKNNEIVGSRQIYWAGTESPNKKYATLEVKSGSGTYQVAISTLDLESWKLAVWDYY